MAPVAIAVLDSFSPAQLQSRTQIVFAPRVCTLVLFTLLAFAICSVGFVLLATQLPQQTTPLRVLSPSTELTPPHALFYTQKRSKTERNFLQSGSKSAKPSALAYSMSMRVRGNWPRLAWCCQFSLQHGLAASVGIGVGKAEC